MKLIRPVQRPRVVLVNTIVTHYRAPLHEAVKAILAAEGIDYAVLYSEPHGAAALKGDTVDLPWTTKVPALHLSLFGRTGVWQRIGRYIGRADLVILQEGNRILHNYPLLLRRRLGCAPPLAFFGHGRNFQETRKTSGERFKRWTNQMVDWWFTYTDRSAEPLIESGFPQGRITVMNNTIDTRSLREDLATVTSAEIMALRRRLGLSADAPVGLFVGGLYKEKRLEFLLEASEAIWRARPDFTLLVAGDGPDRHLFTAERPYLRVLGPTFGRDKAVLLKTADFLLMPGLVGLVVLDAFCAGLPLVTTAIDYHSPEFAYLKDGREGLVVEDASSKDAYAAAVLSLVKDPELRQAMAANATAAADHYSIEAMAQRVAAGVLRALKSPRQTEPLP